MWQTRIIKTAAKGLLFSTRGRIRLRFRHGSGGCIVLNLPGYGGSLNGYRNKYIAMAKSLVAEKHVPVVLCSGFNQVTPFGYCRNLRTYARTILDWVIENASLVCDRPTPRLWIVGNSAGGSAIASLAPQYPQIEKMLLLSPSGDAGEKSLVDGISKFTGEISTMVGEWDFIIGRPAAKLIWRVAASAKRKESIMLRRCDHGFRGSINRQILTRAPLWAFWNCNTVWADYGSKIRARDMLADD